MVGAQPVVDPPGYREAVARENIIRVTACLNLTETICGLSVMPLTPYHLRFLSLVNSPFLHDGITEKELIKTPGLFEYVMAFMWIVSPLFSPGCKSRADCLSGARLKLFRHFEASRLPRHLRENILAKIAGPKTSRDIFNQAFSKVWDLKASEVCAAIIGYMDDAYIDHESFGTSSKAYYCQELVFAYELHKCFPTCFRIDFWNDAPRNTNPSHVPLKLLFQLRKANRAASDAEAILTNKSETYGRN